MSISVISCRHEWPENEGFCLNRETGIPYNVFIHFKTPVLYGINGKIWHLSPGACVICPSNASSYLYSEGRLIHDWVHFEGDAQALLDDYSLRTGEVYYVRDSAHISRLVQSIEKECYSSMQHKADLMNIKFREMMIHISRERDNAEFSEDIASDVYEAFKKLRIDAFANLTKDPSIKELAKSVHLSESRFYVIYRQIFGISPKNDLIFARIERAKSLLEENIYTNAEIAALVGYTNEYHFIRQFKKHTGYTPNKYRKA